MTRSCSAALCIIVEGKEMGPVDTLGKGKEKMVEPQSAVSPGSGDAGMSSSREAGRAVEQDWEVKPYKIHVSFHTWDRTPELC
jgi:hypothetical protein